mgnify:FL=1
MSNQEDFLNIENNVVHLNRMFDISTIANQAGNVDDLLKKLSDYIVKLINNENISFYILDGQIFKSVVTMQNMRADECFESEQDNEAFLSAINEGKIVDTRNEHGDVLFGSFWEKNGLEKLKTRYLRAFFSNGVPVCFCFIGLSDTFKELSAEQREILNVAFDYVEPIIGKYLNDLKREHEISELQKSLYNISILYNISQAVNFIDDLKRLLQVILSKAIDTLDAEKGSLMLYDYSQNSLQVRVVYGLQDKKVEEGINNGIIQCSKIKAGEGVAGMVFLERKPIITNLGSSDPRFIVKDILTNTHSLLCVPLIAKGEAIGVINITNKKHGKLFNQKDLEFMTSLANQAAIAIDNAKLYELATKDGLTKLYIYRHFYTLLENEIRRCARYKRDMSLLMLDIDNFKNVNDTYGHLIGDQILRELARVISETVRKIDIPARYGGEEFVVILPETTKEDAVIIAERLRKNISKITVAANEVTTISPTTSIGVAQYPYDGIDPKTLINSADTALYHSKHNGKNVVSTFSKDGCTLIERTEVI